MYFRLLFSGYSHEDETLLSQTILDLYALLTSVYELLLGHATEYIATPSKQLHIT